MAVAVGTEPANKGIKLPGQVLTPEQMHALLAQCSRKAPTGIRDRALLTVIYRAGLRVSEVLQRLERPNPVDEFLELVARPLMVHVTTIAPHVVRWPEVA
jgi:site-specific recombinase XerC